MFKSGAIKITKLPPQPEGEVKIHAKERQTSAEEKAAKKPDTNATKQPKRQRQIERWLGEGHATVCKLLEIYTDIIPKMINDTEIQGGLRIMHRIAARMSERMAPFVKKYNEDKNWGRRRAHSLAELLFPENMQVPSGYVALEVLQGLHVYLAYIKGGLTALAPVAQALWDKGFIEAVTDCLADTNKTEEWITAQIKVRAPQTLIVPVPIDE